jgi:hypothetical protein
MLRGELKFAQHTDEAIDKVDLAVRLSDERGRACGSCSAGGATRVLAQFGGNTGGLDLRPRSHVALFRVGRMSGK